MTYGDKLLLAYDITNINRIGVVWKPGCFNVSPVQVWTADVDEAPTCPQLFIVTLFTSVLPMTRDTLRRSDFQLIIYSRLRQYITSTQLHCFVCE